MSIVRVMRRGTRPYSTSLAGVLVQFVANVDGHLVANVEDQAVVDRLLAHPESFVLYDGDGPEEPPSPLLDSRPSSAVSTDQVETVSTSGGVSTGDVGKYILRSGDDRLDLTMLSEDQLREFCKVNDIAVHHAAKASTIRDKIVGHFQKA